LAAHGFSAKRTAIVRTPKDLASWLRRHHPTVMVVDVPVLTSREKTILRELRRTARILHFDDRQSPLASADTIVRCQTWPNHAAFQGDTQWLEGPRYVPLRREFLTKRPRPVRPEGSRLLLSLGSGAVTRRVLNTWRRALEPVADHLVVLTGSRVRPSAVMTHVDLAVTAAGQTAFELAHLGIPLITLQVAKSSGAAARTLAQAGAAIHAGHLSKTSPPKLVSVAARVMGDAALRRRLSRAGRRAVDGKGAERILRVMVGPARLRPRRWRPARIGDARWLWRLRNAPRVRRAYLGTRPIPFREHRAWLLRTLNDPDRRLFILLNRRGSRIGQIRLDRLAEDRAEVQISLLKSARGQGYGRQHLTDILAYAARHLGIHTFTAMIKRWNKPSLNLFLSLGFRIVRRRPHFWLSKKVTG